MEDRIEEAAKMLADTLPVEEPKGLVYHAFKEGVKWALENNWISVDDKLPEYGVSVLAHNCHTYGITNRTNHDYARDKNDFILLNIIYDIKYWMPIPSLPDKVLIK